MTREREAQSDVQLSEERSHVAELPPGRDFFEFNGGLVMGESRGMDLRFSFGAWHVGGGRKGKWRVDDALIGFTTLVMVPKDRQGTIENNDFIGNRQDPTVWQGDVKILEKADRVIWQTGNRQFISRPPYWEIRGEHMGVECDLLMGGMGKTTRNYGQWPDLAVTGRAGYEQRCWAEGTITVRGETYEIKDGLGVHDMMTFGDTYDHSENMREPYHYMWCMNDSIQIFLFTMPGEGIGYGHVYVKGKEIPFGPNDVSLDELETWVDPQTAMEVPVRWHANMNSPAGLVDLNVAAGGRGVFCVLNRKGYSVRYAFNSRANGRAYFGGQVIPLQDMVTYVEWGKNAMPLEGGAP